MSKSPLPWSPFDHRKVVDQVPQLRRGRVWCVVCGHTEAVDAAEALRNGWPKHCGQTMTIDSPEEREVLDAAKR